MKRITLSLLFSLVFTALAVAGNYGTDHYALGEFKLAQKWFENNLNQQPAEAHYYLGELAWKEGNYDAARSHFDQGLAADALYPFNMVGKGKTLLKSNPKEAEILFKAALKKNKKNAALQLAIVEAYKENGMKEAADKQLVAARKTGKNTSTLYIYEGDQILAGDSETKVGDAASQFSQAIYFDPSNTVAQIKYAQVYLQTKSLDIPIETLKKVIAEHPDYTIAYRDLATAYSKKGVYPYAIENFKIYFEAADYSVNDISRFASVYYFTDQYEESMKLINEGLSKEPNHFVLNRLRMYNASKSKDTLGVEYAKAFFALRAGADEESKFIYQDDLAYATILADAGQSDAAIAVYNKVLANQDEKIDKGLVYKEMATSYSHMKEYAKAGETYQSYIEYTGLDYTEPNIFFMQGTSYYYAASSMRKDSTETGKALLKEYVTRADSAFANTCRLSPDSYVGYMWRGNVNALLEPQPTEGLAKPYYETAVSIILKKVEDGDELTASYKSQLLRCYQYMSVYYFMNDDKENATLYSNKVLEINPNEAVSKAIFEEYKNQETAKK